MAAAPAPEPARSRLRRRDLDPAFELCRNRPRPSEPRHAAASLRTARRAGARAQRALGGGGLCTDFPGTAADRSRTDGRPQRDRSRAGAPEALPGLRARPAMADRRQQWRVAGIVRRGRRRSPGTAAECDAAVAASAGARAAHRQSRRMARASPLSPAPPGRADRRSRAHRSSERSERLPGAGRSFRKDARCRTRDRGAVPDQDRRRRAVLLQHDHGVRHAGRCDAVRIGARIVLPRRRRHCVGGAASGGERRVRRISRLGSVDQLALRFLDAVQRA